MNNRSYFCDFIIIIPVKNYTKIWDVDISKTKSKNPASEAQIVRISKEGKGHNVNQIQFSPGGGRHGESPYIKISTTDNQGKNKVVFGKKSEYRHEGNERATIIFTEE